MIVNTDRVGCLTNSLVMSTTGSMQMENEVDVEDITQPRCKKYMMEIGQTIANKEKAT